MALSRHKAFCALILLAVCGTIAAPQTTWAEDPPADTPGAAYKRYRVALKQGDGAVALKEAKAAVALARSQLGEEDAKTAVLEINLAQLQITMGNFDEARPLLEQAQKTREKQLGKRHVDLLVVHELWLPVERSTGKYRQVERHHKEILAIIEENHGEGAEYAVALLTRGSDRMDSGSSRAMSDVKKARKLLESLDGDYEREIGTSYFLEGKRELNRKKSRKAEEKLLAALTHFGGSLPDDHPTVLKTHELLVLAYHQLENEIKMDAHLLLCAAEDTSEARVQPLVHVQPESPGAAGKAKRGAWVDLRFGIDKRGHVVDPQVVSSRGGHTYEAAALEAIEKWRYRPKLENSLRVPRGEQRVRMRFKAPVDSESGG